MAELVLNKDNLEEYAQVDLSVFDSIVIDESVLRIPDSYFKERLNEQRIYIRENLQYIGDHAFEGCTFGWASSLENSALNYIGYRAFKGCYITTPSAYLKIGYLTDSTIGMEAFMEMECKYDDFCVYAGKRLGSIGSSAFDSANVNVNLSEAVGLRSIGDSAFYYNYGISELTCYANVTIGDSAFSNCHNITSVDLPNVSAIGENAFSGCTNLSNVNLGLRLKSIENGTFADCTNLSYIYIPYGVSHIGNNAFRNCGDGDIDSDDEGYFIINLGTHRGIPSLGTDVFVSNDKYKRLYIVIPDYGSKNDWANKWYFGNIDKYLEDVSFVHLREGVKYDGSYLMNPAMAFNVNDITFIAETSMTWGEWADSDYSKVYVETKELSSHALSSKIEVDDRKGLDILFGKKEVISWPCYNDVKTVVHHNDRNKRVGPDESIIANATYSTNYGMLKPLESNKVE